MSERQHLGNAGALGGLSELALSHPRAFDVLSRTLNFLPELDPEAAYGALHGAKLWCELDLTLEEGDALLTLSSDDPFILYLLLRAQSFQLWNEEDFKALDIGEEPVHNALVFLRSFMPDWGGHEMSARVGKHADSKRASEQIQLST